MMKMHKLKNVHSHVVCGHFFISKINVCDLGFLVNKLMLRCRYSYIL